MGSNLTDNALLRNDETFLMIDDQSLHDAFLGELPDHLGRPQHDAGLRHGPQRNQASASGSGARHRRSNPSTAVMCARARRDPI